MSTFRWNIYFVVMTTLPAVCNLGKVTFTTVGAGSFKNLIEKGVVVAGKSSLMFSVKSCHSAVIVISDIMAIKDTSGNYFLLMLGNNENTMVVGQDSCFTCKRTNSTAVKALNCDEMKDFWIRWDKKGFFETGSGTAVGVNTLLSLQGQKDMYPINTAAITSTNKITALWEFTNEDTSTTIYEPVPSGSTVVEMSETTPVGADVFDIILKPPNENITFSLNGKTADMFFVNKTKIKLAKSLDYEMKQFHTLSISTTAGLSASMTIVVLNAIDEIPQVNVSDLVIPEELPVGTVIGWNLTVLDPDTNDTLSYKIEGVISDMLTILPNGNLQVTKRIDRDTMDNSSIVSNLTVSVSDAKPHTVTVTIPVEIKDLNDNRPQFNQTIYRTETQEKPTKDRSLLTLSVWDVDEGGNGHVNLSILEGGNSFYLENNTLYVKAGQLDYKRTSTHEETVIVQAVDLPESGPSQSETIVVLVQVLQKEAQLIAWLSPASDGIGSFKEIVMSSSTPPGRTVTKFEVSTANSSDIIRYNVTSKSSAEFDLNPHTGVLKTKSKLERPSYTVIISATSGNISISGTLTVMVQKALDTNKNDSQTVQFDRSVYVVSRPVMGDEGKSLVKIRVLAPNASVINISMDDEGKKAFVLKKGNHFWNLVARQHAVSMPSVIKLTAIDLNSTKRDTSFVVVNGSFTIQGTPSPTEAGTSRASTNTPSCATQSSAEIVTATESQHTTASTTVATTMTTTMTTTTTTTVIPTTVTASTHQTYIGSDSTTMRECPPPSRTKEVAYISVIATQGLAVGALIGVKVFAIMKRKKKKNAIEPERREPVGCEPERNYSSRKGNIKNEATCEDTILEIEDETKNRNHIYSKDPVHGKEWTQDNLNQNSLKDVNIESDAVVSGKLSCLEVGKDCLEDSSSTHSNDYDSGDKEYVTPDATDSEVKQTYPDEGKRCGTEERRSSVVEPSELPTNHETEDHSRADDSNVSDDVSERKADIGTCQPEVLNEGETATDHEETDRKPILRDEEIKEYDDILNQDMTSVDSHVETGNNTIEEPLRPNTEGTLDGEKSEEPWNLQGLTPAYLSHLPGNTPESPTQDEEKNASVYAESTVNETVALSDFIAQDDDFDYTISRMEEGNRAMKDNTMDTQVNIDSLPNFQVRDMYSRVHTSPSEMTSPCILVEKREQKHVINNTNINRQKDQNKVSGQTQAVETLISRLSPSEGAGTQHSVLPQTGQLFPETASNAHKNNTKVTDNGFNSEDDDDDEEEEEEEGGDIKEPAPEGNGTAPATTYLSSQTVAALNIESVKQDVTRPQAQNIPVDTIPPESKKSKKDGKKKKGEKKGKSKKKGASKKKNKKGKGK